MNKVQNKNSFKKKRVHATEDINLKTDTLYPDIKNKKLSGKKKVFFISLLVFIVIIICFIILEIFSIILIKKLGYNWEPAYLKIIKGYKSSNLYGGKTEYQPWGQWNVPNYAGRITNNCIDVKYKFNSYGARDKERSLSGKDRTLVFGDSFIEGWGVDADKTLPADLEKISGKEFLNFGNSGGFSVLNEYILYRDFASKFEHDSVIVGLTMGNDFTDNDVNSWLGLAKLYYRPFWKLSDDKKDIEIVYYAPKVEGKYVPGLEPEKSKLNNKIYDSWKDFSAILQLSVFINDSKMNFSKDSILAKKSNYNLEFSDDEITATQIIYDKFANLIGDKKKYVIIFPSASDAFNYTNNKKQKYTKLEKFKEHLTSQGWKVIDTMGVFTNVPDNEIPQYFICDGHWSVKGNELVAPYIYKSIK